MGKITHTKGSRFQVSGVRTSWIFGNRFSETRNRTPSPGAVEMIDHLFLSGWARERDSAETAEANAE
jgi:hypothetical protein